MMTRNPLGTAVRLVLVLSLVLAPAAFAQNPTGTIIGSVTDANGGALPGVTVSATSENLQGQRTAQTGANGDFKLGFLPAGLYRLTYELEGFSTTVKEVRVPAAQTAIADAQLALGEVVEEIVVTGNIETISETTTASVTYGADEVEDLPINRDIEGAVTLAPGVHETGPSQNISISGAMSFENLWLINGVVVNENVRGQSLPLFIEDAIQETTTSTSGISAEYGRFTGGVINVLTKSGGNDFSGSVRMSFDNDDWESENAPEDVQAPNVDERNDTLEATLGGPIWRDRLWFFTAYRDRELASSTELFLGGSVPAMSVNERFEGKLTASITPSHSLTGSYIEIDQVATNTTFQGVYVDEHQLTDRSDPQELKSLNYTGIMTSNLFVEAQVSEREYMIGVGGGSALPDAPTPAAYAPSVPWYGSGTGGGWYNAALFCADCVNESRNNENALIKGSYFLTTDSVGTHDIVLGYDQFADQRFSVNHQSGSDFIFIDHDTLIDANNNVYPVMFSEAQLGSALARQLDFIWWVPPFNEDSAQSTNYEVNSFYVNDSWQLNDHLSFNLGARYDDNNGQNSAGATVADDSKLSPRVGMTYDVGGDGDLVLNASYGTYVASVYETDGVGATSSAGSLAFFTSWYGGPAINTGAACQSNPSASTCLNATQAAEVILNWYFSAFGGTAPAPVDGSIAQIPNLVSICVPGVSVVIPDTLKSPSADELTVGVTKRLGSRGLARADVVWREWKDFYSHKVDTSTIASTDPLGQVPGLTDITFVGNFGNNVLEREYLGIHTQARWRFTDRFTLSGNYTYSELEGNIDGETAGSGAVADSPNLYPEYRDNAWSYPVGPLTADQKHKARLWGIFEVFNTEHHNLSFSVLTSFFSGQPFEATDLIGTQQHVTNPGYENPPPNVEYFFTDRGAFHWDDMTRTDLSLNYAFGWNLFDRNIEVFFQPEVINVFNEDALIAGNTTVHSYLDTQAVCGGAQCQVFNPFTETPVQGVNWNYGPSFGEARNELDYQTPRTFQFSVGLRF